MPAERSWRFREADEGQVERLADELGISRLLATLLAQRGMAAPEAARAFLEPRLKDLPSPFLMKGMKQAAGLVAAAIMDQRPIAIYGDYDVDGLTAASLLGWFLRDIGAPAACFSHPNRLKDGYGLHAHLVNDLRSRLAAQPGPWLLVVVDCGTADQEAVARARELGFQVLVCDHHRPAGPVPPADGFLNPCQPGCGFPHPDLAAVGVVFFLLMGVRRYLADQGFWQAEDGGPPNLRQYLDLVALGTVADMVPLTRSNRVLVKAGLEEINRRPRPGIRALLQVAGLSGQRVGAGEIAFKLAPLLNAAGRLGDAGQGLAVLLGEKEALVRAGAEYLQDCNQQRRALGDGIFAEAMVMAEEMARQGRRGLVLAGGSWHPGVLGIVASRLAKAYGRPALLLSLEGGEARGSGRSVNGLDLHDILSGCKKNIKRFGGHGAAVGLVVAEERLDAFCQDFEEMLEKNWQGQPGVVELVLDWRLQGAVAGLADSLVEALARLEPFGRGNPEPLFAARFCPEQVRLVGGTHLKFQAREHSGSWTVLGFGLGGFLKEVAAAGELLCAFRIRENRFRGQVETQFHLEDFKL